MAVVEMRLTALIFSARFNALQRAGFPAAPDLYFV